MLVRSKPDTHDDMAPVERYVVLVYQRTSALSHVNEARKHISAFRNRILENIPPTLYALEQNVKRAVYQAGHIWRRSLSGELQVPSPDVCGWERVSDDSQMDSMLDHSPEAAKGCQELFKCECKKAYTNRCKCFKASLRLCFRYGQCNRE